MIIDCGMSWSYLSSAFKECDLDYNKADAILITHQHSDHIAQISRFSHIKIYCAFSLAAAEKIEFYQSFKIKDLEIIPLALSHDSPDTTGYLIKDDNFSLVYISDTGYLSAKNKSYIKNCSYYILESNHDEAMLLSTNRPFILKQRIMFSNGHLSNVDCAANLSELIGNRTREIVLAHLSQEANHPDVAIRTLKEVLDVNQVNYKKINIQAAAQDTVCRGGRI